MTDTAASSPRNFDDIDVFSRFNSGAGHGLEVDLYGVFRRLREHAGVVRANLNDLLGIDRSIWVTPAYTGYTDLEEPVFLAVSYEAVNTVLRDQRAFSQLAQFRAYTEPLGQVLTSLEGERHRGERSLVSQVFTRRSIEVWDEEIIGPVTDALVEQARQTGFCELMSQFAFPFSARVIAGVLGLPPAEHDRMLNMALACISLKDPELAAWGRAGMTAWTDEMIAARQAQPGEGHDLLSLLVRAEQSGVSLTHEQITTFVRFLYPAGFETTYRAMSNTFAALLTTGQWQLLRDDRSLLDGAVAEGLRWETSLIGHPRVAREDVEVCGVPIPAGAVVLAFHAAANRDPARWENPDQFDITRPVKTNATFGFGAHLCIGKPLAEAEIRHALNALLDSFPDLDLDPDADPGDVAIRGVAFRYPERVAVRLS